MLRKSSSIVGGLLRSSVTRAALFALVTLGPLSAAKAGNTNTATALPAAPPGVPHTDLENNTKVIVSPIPEPSSIALAIAALGIVAWKERRAR